MFDRVNHELAFAIANFVQGLATIVAPFLGAAGGVAGFIAAMCLQALSQGFIDAGKDRIYMLLVSSLLSMDGRSVLLKHVRRY